MTQSPWVSGLPLAWRNTLVFNPSSSCNTVKAQSQYQHKEMDMKYCKPLLAPMALTLALAGCNSMPATAPVTTGSLDAIQNVVVIFAENRAFDNLYGLFPGANGIPGVNPSSRGAMCRRRILMVQYCRYCRQPGVG
jgi:phospholipase C